MGGKTCQLICEKFKVARIEQTIFRLYYQNTISQNLNKKRAEVSNTLRSVYKGKLCYSLIFIQLNLTLLDDSDATLDKVNRINKIV